VDSTSRVAIGGVSQATPLRLAYLDRVLEAYAARYGEEMPVDVWNVHGFLLREERGSWGVDIPPGESVDRGVLYEIEDHDDMEMLATFDYFLTARDEAVGYPRDDNRLVQWWAWYSLADATYPTGNLFDLVTGAATVLGHAFARYVSPERHGNP